MVSLALMRVSFSSTREVSVVTFSLTEPTSVRTNFFVAHPVVPAASANTGTTIRNFFMSTTLLGTLADSLPGV